MTSGSTRMRTLLSFAVIAGATPIFGFGGLATIDWHTIDAGGAMVSTGGNFSISGTIGQPDAATNPALSGGSFVLAGGFWPVSNQCFCLGDLNGDGAKDGRDVQKFVECLISGGSCACADVDQLGGVNLLDVTVFVSALLTGPTCH